MDKFEQQKVLMSEAQADEMTFGGEELSDNELDVVNGGCGDDESFGESISKTIDRWQETDDGPNLLRWL